MKADDETLFLDIASLTREEIIQLSDSPDGDRLKAMKPVKNLSTDDVLKIHEVSLLEDIACIVYFLLGVPAGAVTVPLVTYCIGKFVIHDVSKAFVVLGLGLLPLAIIPQRYSPAVLRSWLALRVVRYFSYRAAVSTKARAAIISGRQKGHSQIFVAPPHGVFPFGNLCAILTWSVVWGNHLVALTTTAALNAPGFKQILGSLGFTDASRKSARKALETYPHAIGISTGGVREIFETRSDQECILLKDRYGLIKLAIRTGSDLVPCYVFGNTQLLSHSAGERLGLRNLIENISRQLGFALIIIIGRWGLPIPKRVPVLGVVGNPVSTKHIQKENPSPEEVKQIQEALLKEMVDLFDKYKGSYGWSEKELIIK